MRRKLEREIGFAVIGEMTPPTAGRNPGGYRIILAR